MDVFGGFDSPPASSYDLPLDPLKDNTDFVPFNPSQFKLQAEPDK